MPRILCISPSAPYPVDRGANQRTALLMRALASVGDVDLILVSRYGWSAIDEVRMRYNLVASVKPRPTGGVGPWRWARPINAGAVDRVSEALRNPAADYQVDPDISHTVKKAMQETRYDLVVSRLLWPCAKAGLLATSRGIPVLLDIDDVDHVVAAEVHHNSVSWAKKMVLGRRLAPIRKAVLPLLSKCAHIWIAAPEDGRALEPASWSVLPNIPFSSDGSERIPCPPNRRSHSILVVGNADFSPNSEGLSYFFKLIWPTVRNAVPDATVRIVGSDLSQRLRQQWSAFPGIEPVGFVEDLRAEYERAAFCIAPIYRGGGTKIKGIECFSYGRTAVVTPHSHRGVGHVLKHRQSLWRAENDDEFARGCIHLLTHPDDRDAWARSGNLAVKQHFCFERFESEVHQTVARFLPRADRFSAIVASAK